MLFSLSGSLDLGALLGNLEQMRNPSDHASDLRSVVMSDSLIQAAYAKSPNCVLLFS